MNKARRGIPEAKERGPAAHIQVVDDSFHLDI
jgi:hypothetical protein